MELLEGQWVTDAGLETDLVFNHGIELPEFAAFPLMDAAKGTATLSRYYADFTAIAESAGAGLLLETPTWRASSEWGRALGYSNADLDRVNQDAVALVRATLDSAGVESRVSGCVGPRGDGYVAGDADADAAAEYHTPQIRSFAEAGADLVHAMTMTGSAEAIGVVRAARAVGIPVSVSFTVETDGRLPDGNTLADTFAVVEAAAPADFYGINCAHPVHVLAGLDGGPWQERVTFFRPNASTRSHAELDELDELDAGDIAELVRATRALRVRLPNVSVLGGCCGTDSRHVAELWADAESD